MILLGIVIKLILVILLHDIEPWDYITPTKDDLTLLITPDR